MSPEQCRGRPLDRRSDVFALATVLFEMLTARKLFSGDNELSILEQVREAHKRIESNESFGKVVLMGFGDATDDNPNQTGINPMVPADYIPDLYVPEVFNYNGKVVTDVYASYKFSKHIALFAGADNLFNVHPDLGVNPLARGWFGDNESGGPWDSVQMGFNGLRLFGKLVLNF